MIEAAWLETVAVDGLEELQAFAAYARRLGSEDRNVGEASTLAWAEVHQAIAVVDDAAARAIAQERGVPLRGSVGLIWRGVVEARLTVGEGHELLAALRAAGAWLPWADAEYNAWAVSRGLL